jgi:hypothetical protein
MLELSEIKRMHDKAYTHNQVTRERAADDMLFYWITQWDDNNLGETTLSYRGEFNILRKAGRQIIADLRANPIQIDFSPKADSRDDGADLIDGLYLADDRVNTTLEAYDNASSEAVVCGFGEWELYTEYESSRSGNRNQVIRRRPNYEANNNSFWDPNAKRMDKSDAKYHSKLTPYSPDGYRQLVLDETGEDIGEVRGASFADPEQSYVFPWTGGKNDVIYVVSFHHMVKVKDNILTMVDPLGQPLLLLESDLTKHMDELIETGYTIDSAKTKKIDRWEVTKYIASGDRIISHYVIAGENIPVVPMYGERAFVEDEEHYEGVTRLAKDPQRLRNFQLSYLADIASRSPRPKPIFNPEQIQGFEDMYAENGPDSNFPYNLQNRLAADGQQLPIGPVAMMPEQPVPTSVVACIELSRQAVEDVANPGLPQDIADPDLSGKAVSLLTARLDQQSIVYQQNLKHAKRRDAEIYASMAVTVYDAPRRVTTTLPDGTQKTVQVMETVQDEATGDILVLNDLTNMEFDVYADIGPTYASKKEQTIEQLEKMALAVAQVDPAMMKMLILKQATLVDGVAFDDIRDYARKQLILSGVVEPETHEEEKMMQEAAQQQDKPDPMMVAAMAEMEKAKGVQMETQRKSQADQFKARTDAGKLQVEQFKAQTERAGVEVKAQEVGANIRYTNVKAQGQQIDNAVKMHEPFRARVNGG